MVARNFIYADLTVHVHARQDSRARLQMQKVILCIRPGAAMSGKSFCRVCLHSTGQLCLPPALHRYIDAALATVHMSRDSSAGRASD